MRRLPEDAFVSAFVLYHLGDDAQFQHSIRVADAVDWFDANASSLDLETAKLWRTLSIRLRVPMGNGVAAWG